MFTAGAVVAAQRLQQSHDVSAMLMTAPPQSRTAPPQSRIWATRKGAGSDDREACVQGLDMHCSFWAIPDQHVAMGWAEWFGAMSSIASWGAHLLYLAARHHSDPRLQACACQPEAGRQISKLIRVLAVVAYACPGIAAHDIHKVLDMCTDGGAIRSLLLQHGQ